MGPIPIGLGRPMGGGGGGGGPDINDLGAIPLGGGTRVLNNGGGPGILPGGGGGPIPGGGILPGPAGNGILPRIGWLNGGKLFANGGGPWLFLKFFLPTKFFCTPPFFLFFI